VFGASPRTNATTVESGSRRTNSEMTLVSSGCLKRVRGQHRSAALCPKIAAPVAPARCPAAGSRGPSRPPGPRGGALHRAFGEHPAADRPPRLCVGRPLQGCHQPLGRHGYPLRHLLQAIFAQHLGHRSFSRPSIDGIKAEHRMAGRNPRCARDPISIWGSTLAAPTAPASAPPSRSVPARRRSK
jgi:hypothetical protein